MTLREFFDLPVAQRKAIMLEVARRATEAQLAKMVGEDGALPGPVPPAVAAPIK